MNLVMWSCPLLKCHLLWEHNSYLVNDVGFYGLILDAEEVKDQVLHNAENAYLQHQSQVFMFYQY